MLTIPELVHDVRASATPWQVEVSWAIADSSADTASVYRRSSGGAGSWDKVADITASTGSELSYVDRAVQPGSTHEYRLGFPVEQRQIYRGEIAVDIPRITEFELSVAPNPSSKGAAMTVVIPSSEPAKLEVLDVGGRILGSSLLPVGPGRFVVPLPSARRPGIYFVRLHQQGRTQTARVAIVP